MTEIAVTHIDAPIPRMPLVAAATLLDVSDRTQAAELAKLHQNWQPEAWAYYDLIGEMKYAIGVYLANSIANIGVFVAEAAAQGNEPEQVDLTAGDEALERLGDLSEILRAFTVNLSVAGECFLVGSGEGEDESWSVASVDELTFRADGYMLQTAPAATRKRLDASDTVIRAWLKHARYSALADSPVHGLLTVCEQIKKLELAINALSVSRLGSSKVLIVPAELSFGNLDPVTELDGDPGSKRSDPVNESMMQAFTLPIQEPGSASAVAPIILRPPGAMSEQIRMLDFDRPIDDKLDGRLELALRRLSWGLNVPPEIVTGFQATRYSNAFIIDEQAIKAHIEPLASQIMVPLTKYLRGALKAGDMSAEKAARYVVWFDASRLISPSSRSDDADSGHDRFTISDAAWRAQRGFAEDDAPDDEEVLRRLGIKRGQIDPILTAELLKSLATAPLPIGAPTSSAPNEEPVPPPTNRPSPNGEMPPRLAAARLAAAAPRDVGRELADLDNLLRERIMIAADSSMRRALERAGARLASAAKKHPAARRTIESVPASEVAATLGPLRAAVPLTDDEMLESAFDDLGMRFDSWTRSTQRRALGYLGSLSESERGELESRQDRDRSRAWTWLLAALLALARRHLYEPREAERGEVDATLLVSYGYARGATAIAGGVEGWEITGDGLFTAGGRPVGGVGTGELMREQVLARGGAWGAYQWDYGLFPRDTFEPHLRLDGVVVDSFTDESLRNPEAWPPIEFYQPGDHRGCRCGWIPQIRLPVAAGIYPSHEEVPI